MNDIKKFSDAVQEQFAADRTLLSFSEYLEIVEAEPHKHLRSSAQYLVDLFDFYGTTELQHPTGNTTRYKLFDMPFNQGENKVAGQEKIQEQIYLCLKNFARQGQTNKLILLHGPNGSAKSSMVRCMMSAMEDYSKREDGALYTFNWIFPNKTPGKEQIGFGENDAIASTSETFAFLNAEDIDARIPSEMHDHPLFLIPCKERMDFIDSAFPEGLEGETKFQLSHYLRFGDLSQKNRKIFDALLTSYNGRLSEVLKHIQVERFYISKRYRKGAATIEPQLSVDAKMQQVTADKTLAALPKALHHVSLFEPHGPLVSANRGILEYADLLKRPVESFKYLLSTVETSNVEMDSFALHLDMVLIASTNDTYLEAFKEHPDFPSFKGRMELIKVPYLLHYAQEKEIYTQTISEKILGKHVAPHTIEIVAFWGVLTRMRRNDPERHAKAIRALIKDLTPIEKLRLYDKGDFPERLTRQEERLLLQNLPLLYKETLSYPNYEGRFGASARELKTILLNAAHDEHFDFLNPESVFLEIENLLGSKSVYPFLKQEIVGKFHDHKAFLEQTRDLYLDLIDDEIRESMGLTANHSELNLFTRYVDHVSHWVKKEKLWDPVANKYADPDLKLMEEIEDVLMSKKEKVSDFRHSIISAIAAKALERPGEKPDYSDIFRNFLSQLKNDFFEKRRSVIVRMNTNFLKHSADEPYKLEAKEVEQCEKMFKHLQDSYGYNMDSARAAIAFLMKHRYEKESDRKS